MLESALLVVKLLLAPALIGLATLVTRRWGPGAGGWFSALPLTSGPVMLILALERGPRFAVEACGGVLLALVSLAAFALAYGWSARRASWGWSSLAGCAAYLACVWPLGSFAASPAVSFVASCAFLALTLRWMPEGARTSRTVKAPEWDVPLRMALAAVMVWGLTRAASAVGPRMSGLLTPFPVVTTVLAAFTHHFDGAAAVGQLLRSLLVGLFSFALFFLVVGLAIGPYGVGAAFAAATLCALAAHAGVWRWVGAQHA